MKGKAWEEALAGVMLDRQAEELDVLASEHTIQVTSFGGCGTTALYDYLGAAGLNIPKVFGQFPFKHQRVPPAPTDVPPGFRVVYLYGDPRNAVLSLFRRDAQFGHYRGMRMEEPPREATERLSDLASFLRAGIDDFRLEDHFQRWWSHGPDGFPVLFVEYEKLASVWPTLRAFVGLPEGYPGVPWRPRSSDWRTLPADMQEQIDDMYGHLARRVSSLPAVVPRGAATT